MGKQHIGFVWTPLCSTPNPALLLASHHIFQPSAIHDIRRPTICVEERVRGEIMEGQQQLSKSRVLKVESEETWDLLTTQANNQGCPVLAHFTASWCVPSLAMNSYFEELAMNYQDILFLLVDVDDVKGIATRMEVTAMPTFVLMRGGVVIDRMVGANPDEMRKRVAALIPSLRPSDVVE